MNFDFSQHLNSYKKLLLEQSFRIERFKNSMKEQDFSYLTESSSVYSSNIEGNTLNVNSFMNAKLQKTASKEVEEIQNLIAAYDFAQNNGLTQQNFLNIHKISSQTLLIPSKR